jgi:hypothetical protein
MRDHVPVERELRVPPCYAHVEGFLQRHDADLRLRRSLTHPTCFVLERRCRRRPAANVGIQPVLDHHVQVRDGYIHVSTVHASWLERPWRIVEALTHEGRDLWAVAGGLARLDSEERYEERWAKETKRRKRREMFKEIFREGRATLQRMAGSRISHAGMPTT